MKLRGRVTVAGRPSSWRAAGGIVLIYAGVDLLANAVRRSFDEGWRGAAQICGDLHGSDNVDRTAPDEPGRAPASEPGDGPRDAAGES